MPEGYDLGGVNPILLRECYDLASQYEQLDAAKNILRDKSKRLDNNDSYSDQCFMPIYESYMQIISGALYELSLEGHTATDNRETRFIQRTYDLSETAEKEFVLALLALRNGRSETQRLEALNHIRKAQEYSPNDPRYLALATILINASQK